MEVGGTLAGEGTVGSSAILGSAVALKSLLDDGRILPVVVGVHLHVRCANIDFIAAVLYRFIIIINYKSNDYIRFKIVYHYYHYHLLLYYLFFIFIIYLFILYVYIYHYYYIIL